MLPRTRFYPQRQFHLLINFKNDERSVAILPDDAGKFLVVDQGTVVGEFDYDKQLNCVSSHCHLDDNIISQVQRGIRSHFS
ncbi:MAG TPA: hypothetical protein VHS53_06575 [Mucilaginibacter sp.]|nr:hypothetical protein [Mucilaginibacter sp.]HWD87743.1 hypothetical protein [Mucilaginibacter sp.]